MTVNSYPFTAGLPLSAAELNIAIAAALVPSPGMTCGRLTGMTIKPTTGLSVAIAGSYRVYGQDRAVVSTITLPNTTQIYYIIGDEAGVVSVTSVAPPSVYPKPSNTVPVLLATVTPVPVGTYHDQFERGDDVQVTFSGDTRYIPLVPGTIHVHVGAIVGDDDGAGNITGAGVVSGTVDYVTGALSITFSVAPAYGEQVIPYFDWIQTAVHKSWITLYPPVDNPAAWARKLAFDAGLYRIPGKDYAVGLPSTTPLSALRNPLLDPFGQDSVVGNEYRVQTSRHEFWLMGLQGMFYLPPSSEGAVITAVDDDGFVALTGFPDGNYLDATTITGSLSDGTPLGPFTLDQYGVLVSAELPATVWAGQTVDPIIGGGIRDISIRHSLIDAYDKYAAVSVNESGATNLSALYQGLIVEDTTITWSYPNGLSGVGGTFAFLNAGPMILRRVRIDNVSEGISPFHMTIAEEIDMTRIGISDGAHANGVYINTGVHPLRAIDGNLGYSRISHFRISMPPPQSLRYELTTSTALISIQRDADEAVGSTDNIIEDGLLDGGTFWVAINASRPIRRTTFRNLWTWPSEFEDEFYYWPEFNTHGFRFRHEADAADILIYNILDADTGEVFLELNGLWAIVAGELTRAPVPAVDFYNRPTTVLVA